MSNVTVRIPTPLRAFTDGMAEVGAAGVTVGEVLANLTRSHPGLGEHLLGRDGQLRSFVNVYVGSDSVRSLGGLETPVADGAVLSIIPAVAGGCSAPAGQMGALERTAAR